MTNAPPPRRAVNSSSVIGAWTTPTTPPPSSRAAIDLCYVAAGRFDAYYEQWLNPWDLAAGELIAREAGARIGEFPGRDDGEPSGLLAASPGIYDEMMALLERS